MRKIELRRVFVYSMCVETLKKFSAWGSFAFSAAVKSETLMS